MNTPLHIRQRIDQNRARREITLDLRNQALLEVPPEIRALTHLEQLLLGNNAIQRLPAWLAELPALRFIQLNINPLHDVGKVPNLVLDCGTWWRLQPDPRQVAGLWLRCEAGEMWEEALRLPDLRWLDLSRQRLREVPKAVWGLEKLEALDLALNKLKVLPSKITQLQNLILLNLSGNGLSMLPAEIIQLQNLSRLYLSGNGLGTLPAEIMQLQNLSQLDLSGNGLGALPVEIMQLQNLSRLGLGGNELGTLPAEIMQLQSLSELDLSGTGLDTLPAEIMQLQGITKLDLSYNKFTIFPLEISMLTNILVLNLWNNQLSTLPLEIVQLQNLSQLGLGSNRLSALPPEIKQLQDLSQLDLSFNSCITLPQEVAQLQNLSQLNLNSIEFETFPLEITQLQNLSRLELNGNRLSTLPLEIRYLQNLSQLGLSFNAFIKLPIEIIQLQNLCQIDLAGNGFSTLPVEITQLENLSVLKLWDNKFSRVPEEILQLQNLSQLELSGNEIGMLSPKIIQLQNLVYLDLHGNHLNTVPDGIGELFYLTELNIASNRIHRLPPSLAKLDNLRTLTVKYRWKDETNYLESPSLTALDLDEDGRVNITTMRRWFADAATQGLTKVNEAKLLIIGEGGAGKTTLARRLMDPGAALPEKAESTEGIDVWQWELDADFRLNLWDFGGQEIFHATHQFFFSDSALYALVADTRRSDTDFYWWLNVVEKFGKTSPVFIVKNERDGRPFQLPDEAGLRARFSNLKEIFAANLADQNWHSQLRKFIDFRVRDLPHLSQDYPKTWVKVRRALEADPRPYISRKDYFALCREHDLQHDSGEALLGLLHQLGVCLHFADIAALRKTVILKPTWATEAVYRVLDDKDVQHQLGRFCRADVVRIWRNPKAYRISGFLQGRQVQCEWRADSFEDMHDELLAMMQAFELCYALPEAEQYIAPQLLSRARLEYEFPAHDVLTIKYDYTGFMPKGITGRLAVKLHDWIEDRRRRIWRHGVVFAHGGARAEVREDFERRELVLRIAGDNRRDMSTVLMHELARIHRGFYHLEFKILVPCQCARAGQAFFRLEVLQKFARDRRHIQCQECYDELNAQDLLDGILSGTEREADAKTVLLESLKRLLPAELEDVIMAYGAPAAYLTTANPAQRAIDLLRYAEGRRELAQLQAVVEKRLVSR